MHKEILLPAQIDILPLLSQFAKQFYLVGGTAIALQIGHRRSIDFDLFTFSEFNHAKIINLIRKNGFTIDRIIHQSSDQIHLMLNGVKLTFFQFPFHIDAPLKLENNIKVPELLTLAGMKAFALGGRAKWKDYVDLYFLLKDHYSFINISERAKVIFKENFNEKLFRQQLAWYNDIDYSESIDYLVSNPTDQEIKSFLTEVTIIPF
jgi:hypothetical protein